MSRRNRSDELGIGLAEWIISSPYLHNDETFKRAQEVLDALADKGKGEFMTRNDIHSIDMNQMDSYDGKMICLFLQEIAAQLSDLNAALISKEGVNVNAALQATGLSIPEACKPTPASEREKRT